MWDEVLQCRSCGAAIVFVRTKRGRLSPYNVDPKTRTVTTETHWGTCPASDEWSTRSRRARGRQDGRRPDPDPAAAAPDPRRGGVR